VIDVPRRVRSLFAAAGWRPGRRTEVPLSIPLGHPAAEIYSSFEGASVDLSAVLFEVSVVLVSFNRSSSARITRMSPSGTLVSVAPTCGMGGAGSKPKTSAVTGILMTGLDEE
jgi:hypothetical protein